jgi:hypothetical protein
VDGLVVRPEDTLEQPKGITPIAIPDGVDPTVFRSVVAAYTTGWRTKGARPTIPEVRALWPRLSETHLGEIMVTPEFRAAMESRGIDIGDTPGLTHQQHLFLMAYSDPHDRRSQSAKLKAVGANTQQLGNWNRNPVFMRARQALGHRIFEDAVPDIQITMTQQALAGSFNHQNFIMETLGEGPKAREQQSAKEAIQEIVYAIQRATQGNPEMREKIMQEIRIGRMAAAELTG